MRRFVVKCLLNALALYIAAALIPGMAVADPKAAIGAGIGLGLIHLLFRPILLLVALPVNLLTFGLFTVVIDTWLVMVIADFVSGIFIPGFGAAVLTALIIAVVNCLVKDLYD